MTTKIIPHNFLYASIVEPCRDTISYFLASLSVSFWTVARADNVRKIILLLVNNFLKKNNNCLCLHMIKMYIIMCTSCGPIAYVMQVESWIGLHVHDTRSIESFISSILKMLARLRAANVIAAAVALMYRDRRRPEWIYCTRVNFAACQEWRSDRRAYPAFRVALKALRIEALACRVYTRHAISCMLCSDEIIVHDDDQFR